MSCEKLRESLLDYVYGALDDGEASEVRRHLEACAACREALVAAHADREALARASRADLPDLSFAPPVLRGRRLMSLRRLALAATVLAAVAGLLLYRSRLRAPVLAENPRMVVQGPASLPPDAESEFTVRTATISGDAIPTAIHACVWNGGERPAFERTLHSAPDGTTRIAIPAGLGKPGDVLGVTLEAAYEGGQDRVAALVAVEASRLAAYVSTDKPLYRPGEPVRCRAVVLTRFQLTPAGRVPLAWKLLDAKDQAIRQWGGVTEDGVGEALIQLPPGLPGGEYRVVLTHPQSGFAKTERKIQVRAYRVPRLKTEIELDRESYGPGDEAIAYLSVTRAEGGVPEGATVEAVVTVDGAEVLREKKDLAADGTASVRFALPDEIEAGRGQVACTFTDGGTVEGAAETIPITLDRLKVDLFPEGGDLVGGLANRVYFSVRDMKDEPAELRADVLDSAGETVAQARTDVLGMGRFTLRPEPGETYRLVPKSPAGIELQLEAMRARTGGVVLTSLEASQSAGGPLRLSVAATEAGEYRVVAWCRGVLVGQESVRLDGKDPVGIALSPTEDVGGVIRVTVLDPDGLPRAERLISRAPARRVRVEVASDKVTYAPGEQVTVNVKTADENGNPIPACLGVRVVDDAVLALADDEDTAPLPLHFLLGMEVEELEEAAIFAEGPESARAVDLLLGVQGWRRFAWQDPEAFLVAYPEAGARVLPPPANGETVARLDNLEEAKAAAARGLDSADRKTLRLAGWVVAGLGALFLLRYLLRLRPLLRSWKPYASLGTAAAGLLLALLLAPVPVPAPEPAPQPILAPAGSEASERPFFGATQLGLSTFTNEPITITFNESLYCSDSWTYWWAYDPNQIASLKASLEGRYLESFPLNGQVVFEFGDEVSGFRSVGGWLYQGAGGGGGGGSIKLDAYLGIYVPSGGTVRPDRPPNMGGAGGGAGGYGYFDVYGWRYPPFAREYSHVRVRQGDGVRRDFTEVLYWNSRLATGEDGTGSFTFQTSDSVTTFRIKAEAHDRRGALAVADGTLRNRVPFWVDVKLPVELARGDRLDLPVTVANDTASEATATVTLQGSPAETTKVSAGARGRVAFELTAEGNALAVRLDATGPDGLTDKIERTVPVVPSGYPLAVDRSGVLDREAKVELRLPEALDRTTLRGSLRLYPSVGATLEDGLESMLREPCGCFEQVSSSNYPNILILTYLDEQGTGSAATARKAKEYLKKGYDLLAGYEVEGGGFEWFGGTPAHEALTAYGVMEFTEMAKFIDVDREMIDRTLAWLLSRRDGKGGFLTSPGSHSFGSAPQEVHDSYILWALTEAGCADGLSAELALLAQRAARSEDPYLVALAVLALGNEDRPEAASLAEHLAALQREDGSLAGTTSSITASRGSNLTIETTALASLAFTRQGRAEAADRAMTFLAGQRSGGGGFGATQATILTLKALVEHARATRQVTCAHDLTVLVNGETVAIRSVAEGAKGVIVFEREVLDALRPGENVLEIRTSGEEPLPFAFSLTAVTDRPDSDPDCAVGVESSLAKTEIPEGGTVGLKVRVTNRGAEPVPMTVARIGLPAGLSPRPDQLEERKKAGDFDHYEIRPREVTLYWRGIAGEETREIHLELLAEIPGEFTGPATSAYLYYASGSTDWAAPLKVRITR